MVGAIGPRLTQGIFSRRVVAKLQRRDQGIDLFGGVVEAKGGAAGRRDAHVLHERHGAMRAGSHRDAALSSTVEMSCAWAAPCSEKLKIAPLVAELPCTFSQFRPSKRERA